MQNGFADSLVIVLFFVGATLGHFTLTVRSHNWWYGLALPRWTGKLIHVGHGLLVLAAPILYWQCFGYDVLAPFSHSPTWHHIVAGYLGTGVREILGFSLVVLVLLARPWGLFGQPAVRRV